MRCYLAYLAAGFGTLVAYFGVAYVQITLGLVHDGHSISFLWGLLQALPATIIFGVVAYQLLSRLVFRGRRALMRFLMAWAALTMIEKGCFQFVVLGILSGPQAMWLLFFLAAVPGFFLIRDWVFRQQQNLISG